MTWISNDLIGVDYGYNAAAVNLEGQWVANLGEWIIGKADYTKADSPLVLTITDRDNGHRSSQRQERKENRISASHRWKTDCARVRQQGRAACSDHGQFRILERCIDHVELV